MGGPARRAHLRTGMPFVEISGLDVDADTFEKVAVRVTDAIVETLSVSADTVTIYAAPDQPSRYAHGGSVESPTRRRLFVKLNILARSIEVRRKAAAAVCDALSGPTGHNPRDIAIYFLERALEQVSHAGILECDRPPAERNHLNPGVAGRPIPQEQ